MDQLIYRRPWLDRESAREAISEYINCGARLLRAR
jgi:hypothetical protein